MTRRRTTRVPWGSPVRFGLVPRAPRCGRLLAGGRTGGNGAFGNGRRTGRSATNPAADSERVRVSTGWLTWSDAPRQAISAQHQVMRCRGRGLIVATQRCSIVVSICLEGLIVDVRGCGSCCRAGNRDALPASATNSASVPVTRNRLRRHHAAVGFRPRAAGHARYHLFGSSASPTFGENAISSSADRPRRKVPAGTGQGVAFVGHQVLLEMGDTELWRRHTVFPHKDCAVRRDRTEGRTSTRATWVS